MGVSENIIRAELAERLYVVEPGLQITDIEKFVRASLGASGFVDIVARDRIGNIVLVELKRSAAASREALHELLKYLGLFVEEHGLKRAKVRCLIVSTDWRELITPYSELARTGAFQFEGFHLAVDERGVPSSAQRVEPREVEEAAIAPPYLLLCYGDPVKRADVAESMQRSLEQVKEVSGLIAYLDHSDPSLAFPKAICVALARLEPEPSEHAATEASHDDDDDDDDDGSSREWSLIMSADEAAPHYEHDHQSIGAFQLVALLNNGWTTTKWLRVGSLWKDEALWTADDLSRLLFGYESANGMYLTFFSKPRNQLDWDHRREQVADLFSPDPPLAALTTAWMDDVCAGDRDGTLALIAFYPEDLVLAACSPVLEPEDRFGPSIEFVWVPSSDPQNGKIFRCLLRWGGDAPPRSGVELVEGVYDSWMGYQLASVMHEHFCFRDRVLTEFGWEWAGYETSLHGKEAREVRLSGSNLVRQGIKPKSIRERHAFVEANWDWVCDLAEALVAAGVWRPARLTNAAASDESVEFQGAPDACVRCGRTFSGVMYDAALPPDGRWACLCRFCFCYCGGVVGWGSGQKYVASEEGGWIRTEGGPPSLD